jgi:hypothetical protein
VLLHYLEEVAHHSAFKVREGFGNYTGKGRSFIALCGVNEEEED